MQDVITYHNQVRSQHPTHTGKIAQAPAPAFTADQEWSHALNHHIASTQSVDRSGISGPGKYSQKCDLIYAIFRDAARIQGYDTTSITRAIATMRNVSTKNGGDRSTMETRIKAGVALLPETKNWMAQVIHHHNQNRATYVR